MSRTYLQCTTDTILTRVHQLATWTNHASTCDNLGGAKVGVRNALRTWEMPILVTQKMRKTNHLWNRLIKPNPFRVLNAKTDPVKDPVFEKHSNCGQTVSHQTLLANCGCHVQHQTLSSRAEAFPARIYAKNHTPKISGGREYAHLII